MSDKKISNTYFDIIYIFGGAIITGLIRNVIEGIVKAMGLNLESLNTGLSVGIGLLIWLISVWVGVMVVSSYINKNYKLESKEKALRSALIFFFVFILVASLALFFIGIPIQYIIVLIIQALFSGAALYFFGKKYIKETKVEEN